jgi:hypothetical protein
MGCGLPACISHKLAAARVRNGRKMAVHGHFPLRRQSVRGPTIPHTLSAPKSSQRSDFASPSLDLLAGASHSGEKSRPGVWATYFSDGRILGFPPQIMDNWYSTLTRPPTQGSGALVMLGVSRFLRSAKNAPLPSVPLLTVAIAKNSAKAAGA